MTLGTVRFIAIDTNIVQAVLICNHKEDKPACLAELRSAWVAQLEWLNATLASPVRGATHPTWTIVFGHHPVYAAGKWSVVDSEAGLLSSTLVPLFERSGVTAYLCGHDHVSQVIEAGSVMYAIFGAGGGAEQDDEPLALRSSLPPTAKITFTAVNGSLGFGAVHVSAEKLCVRVVGVKGEILFEQCKPLPVDRSKIEFQKTSEMSTVSSLSPHGDASSVCCLHHCYHHNVTPLRISVIAFGYDYCHQPIVISLLMYQPAVITDRR